MGALGHNAAKAHMTDWTKQLIVFDIKETLICISASVIALTVLDRGRSRDGKLEVEPFGSG
jgi:hypothetical protein